MEFLRGILDLSGIFFYIKFGESDRVNSKSWKSGIIWDLIPSSNSWSWNLLLFRPTMDPDLINSLSLLLKWSKSEQKERNWVQNGESEWKSWRRRLELKGEVKRARKCQSPSSKRKWWEISHLILIRKERKIHGNPLFCSLNFLHLMLHIYFRIKSLSLDSRENYCRN